VILKFLLYDWIPFLTELRKKKMKYDCMLLNARVNRRSEDKWFLRSQKIFYSLKLKKQEPYLE